MEAILLTFAAAALAAILLPAASKRHRRPYVVSR